ncbi:MAG: hypothetical protein V7642_3933, partial [Burkholderiales bacterium]
MKRNFTIAAAIALAYVAFPAAAQTTANVTQFGTSNDAFVEQSNATNSHANVFQSGNGNTVGNASSATPG